VSGGFPQRPDRDSFGPEVVNSAPVRDSRRQWDASIANLVMHQCAGLGLVSPRTALVFSASPGPAVLGRVEAWNVRRETASPYNDPTLTRTGAGNYLVTYPTPIPDDGGVDQAVSFIWALPIIANADPTVFRHAQAAVDAQTNRMRVCIFDGANALVDGSTVVLLGW
jgi:hypothetical protein